MTPALAHIDTWIFDLDNTLYPARANLFAQIDKRMAAFIMRLLGCGPEEARRIQKQFFHDHGTTLRGLMDQHGVDPHEFLDFVHDIDIGVIERDDRLVQGIGALPGRKLIFTNADAPYAEKILGSLGLDAAFEAIHDIHAMGYRPKPEPECYRALCTSQNIDPARAIFIEDMARNLIPAKAIGMTTVWVDNGSESGFYLADPRAIDIQIEDLGDWLEALTQEGQDS